MPATRAPVAWTASLALCVAGWLVVHSLAYQHSRTDIATFGAQAEACARYLAQGRQISFDGRLAYH
jgi:single-stranded DNA-binding protein